MRALTLFVLGTCLSAGTAFAQPSPPPPTTEADKLFEEGRQLLEGGRADEACPKFEASQKLDPARGTLINIGACYAATGRLVEALAVYKDVEQQSIAANDQTRVQAARTQIAALDKIIPHVTIALANRVPGVAVELDGVAVPESEWADHRRNPGQVTVRASAAGHQDYSATETVKADGATTAITIPALVPTIVEPPPIEPQPTPIVVTTPSGSSRKKLAYIVGGGGVVLFGASTVMAFMAKSKHDEATGEDGTCRDMMGSLICTDPDDAKATTDARSLGNIATVIGAAGLVAVGAGVVLYLTAPKTETIVTPTVTPEGAGISVSGSF